MILKPPSVKPTDSIEHVAMRMSDTGTGLAFITTSGGRPRVVRDTDLRKAVLGGTSPLDPVEPFITRPKMWLSVDESKSPPPAEASRGEDLIPVFDGHQTVGAVETDLSKPLAGAIAVVMAGGRGQRLRPLTDKVPKPLLRIGGSTIVERIIGAIASAGVNQVYLSVNYKARVFESRLKDGAHLGIDLSYLKEKEKLDTAGSLSLLPARPKGPLLVTNADIMTRLGYRRILRHHLLSGADATMAVVMHEAPIPYGVVETNGDRMVGMKEKPSIRVPCNAGIYVLSPTTLKLIGNNESIGMPQLLERILTKGGTVKIFPLIERWFDIGSPEDFQRVLMEFATGEEQ